MQILFFVFLLPLRGIGAVSRLADQCRVSGLHAAVAVDVRRQARQPASAGVRAVLHLAHQRRVAHFKLPVQVRISLEGDDDLRILRDIERKHVAISVGRAGQHGVIVPVLHRDQYRAVGGNREAHFAAELGAEIKACLRRSLRIIRQRDRKLVGSFAVGHPGDMAAVVLHYILSPAWIIDRIISRGGN